MQAVLRLVYPPRCLGCDACVTDDGRLCGSCRAETPFIGGLVCDACGVAVPQGDGRGLVSCEDCLATPRPWARGRAALDYKGRARRLVLALKHGDRQDIADPAARWMAEAARPIMTPGMVVVPVPAHWIRMVQRRYNQAALLANALGKTTGHSVCADALVRHRRTRRQDGLSPSQRFDNIIGSKEMRQRAAPVLRGKSVLLVDDVMTSGATLAAGTQALLAGGADRVCVVVLARVAKDT